MHDLSLLTTPGADATTIRRETQRVRTETSER